MLPCDLDAHMEVIKQVTKADLGGYALPIYEGAGSVWGGAVPQRVPTSSRTSDFCLISQLEKVPWVRCYSQQFVQTLQKKNA